MVEEVNLAKKRRYSREPDLEVIVEDETFHVHSRDLMFHSDVFAGMLESGMKEDEQGRIWLPGKSKDEFRLVLQHLFPSRDPGDLPPIEWNHVRVLLQWADEYQIEGLTARCEQYLLNQVPVSHTRSFVAMQKSHIMECYQLGVTYRLSKLQAKCAGEIGSLAFEYRYELKQLSGNDAFVKEILPKVYEEVGLSMPEFAPSEKINVEHLWPLVIRALEAMHHWGTLEVNQMFVSHCRSMIDVVFKTLSDGGRPPLQEGLTMTEIQRRLPDICPRMVESIVNKLMEKGTATKGADGKYCRTSEAIFGHGLMSPH